MSETFNEPKTRVTVGVIRDTTTVVSQTLAYAPTTHDHDDRYYTETEADGRFVRTVNNTEPDANGNVTVSVEGGGTSGTAISNNNNGTSTLTATNDALTITPNANGTTTIGGPQ